MTAAGVKQSCKVEKSLGHISSTGFCFIILTSKSVWQLRGGGHLWGYYGYLLLPSLIAKHFCDQFSRPQYPSSYIIDEFNKSANGLY